MVRGHAALLTALVLGCGGASDAPPAPEFAGSEAASGLRLPPSVSLPQKGPAPSNSKGWVRAIFVEEGDDPCARDNGGCGDPKFWTCASEGGAAPTCTDVDECSRRNGGCGDPALWACTNNPGAPATCSDVDECLVDNGGCGESLVFACTNNEGAQPSCAERSRIVLQDRRTIAGSVAGLGPGAQAAVILGSDGYLASQTVSNGGQYRFESVPDGTYFLKLDVSGHSAPRAKTIVVEHDGANYPSPAEARIDLRTAPLASDRFVFHWEEDASRSGESETAQVNRPPVVHYLGQSVPVPDVVAADHLEHDYNIILSDEGSPWNQEYAYRLLETMKTIPQTLRSPDQPQTLKPSKWVLFQGNMAGDIQITYGIHGNEVMISDRAFIHAAPRLVEIDGVRGAFFSKRLHHALVRYVTRSGADADSVERILTERFGCTTRVPDHSALTLPTTREDMRSFQQFHPEELVSLINMFEEMPARYRSIAGLEYLVRRRDGMPHPWYPAAPAVAWALPGLFPEGSYIEFMESAFLTNPDHMHRLILHEKAHFLWGYLLSEALKEEWIAVGGWYENPNDPDGWSTTDTTGFVTPYAHENNPNEDLAESISYYVLDPALLLSRSPAKYNFLRDRIMHGYRYISRIHEDLTFQVLNLSPDYTYPGKIRRVDIAVDGAPEQDKRVSIEIELHTLDNVFAGASGAYLRLYSPIGTWTDVRLAPRNPRGSILSGGFTLSRYAKAGLWRTDQIVITDLVGNQRPEGVDDFGWRLWVENTLEDVRPPRYVPGSLRLEVQPDVVREADGEHPVHRARVTWLVDEDRAMPVESSVHAYLRNPASVNTYSHQGWGYVDPSTSIATIDILLTDFHASGSYGVPSIMMVDAAGNRTGVSFGTVSFPEPEVFVTVLTTDPDTLAPEVSLNDDPASGVHRILVSAVPTNPDSPDGETVVTIRYQARDDKSGVGVVSYRLLDPQGISHAQFHYHENFYTTFFQGVPSSWGEYRIDTVLPVGSAPGTWGLQELVVLDKAGNRLALSFVETMHFEILR